MSTSRLQAVAERPPLLTIALVSAAALGYEILLIRLFSIIQWHHSAYVIISLALLGYGLSGTFLSFIQTRLLQHYPLALILNLALFALSVIPCFWLAQKLQFNPEAMLWHWRESLRLVAVYLVLTLPFFFAANAIALTLSYYRARINRVYAADLFGAGIGSLAVVALLYLLPPIPSLTTLSLTAVVCLITACAELRLPIRQRVYLLALLLAVVNLGIGSVFKLELSPYKALSQALQVEGARLIGQRHSPLGVLQVLENQRVPQRYAPGMSLNARGGPPPQLSIYSDGDSLGSITRDRGDRDALRFLDQLTSALPYHLQTLNKVVIIGAGGGMDVMQAHYHQAAEIHVVELNPQIITLLQNEFEAFTHALYSRPGVSVHIEEARAYLNGRDQQYQLIQMSLQSAGGASAAGLYALNENYLYTTEAIGELLASLQPGGYLAITQWLKLPPRDSLKLLATAIETLQTTGSQHPDKQIMLIRGWQTSTLLIKNAPFSAGEIDSLRRFNRQRAFDVVWYPGMAATEANRYNKLREPIFHNAAKALLGPDKQHFINSYKFELQPASDDRPFFHNFFKWSTLDEILDLRDRGGLPLLDSGYPVVIATLAQAVMLSLVLILLPMRLFTRQRAPVASSLRLRVVLYFTAIGLAFLFLEIALVQKFMRFLHHPVFTTAVVLASFLVFAGLGSFWSQVYCVRNSQRGGMSKAAIGIILTGLAYLVVIDKLFQVLAPWPLPARMLFSSGLIAPLAFFMGAPFPLALSTLGKQASALIPLAWSVNGCASVISAVLATVLAIHFGFTVVILLALTLYGFAVLVFPGDKTYGH